MYPKRQEKTVFILDKETILKIQTGSNNMVRHIDNNNTKDQKYFKTNFWKIIVTYWFGFFIGWFTNI